MIRLTCWHEVNHLDEAYEVIMKGSTRKLDKAIDYKLVCKECFDYYKKHKMLFNSEKQAMEWLENEQTN